MNVSCPVGIGNWTLFFWKSNPCFAWLSYTRPVHFFFEKKNQRLLIVGKHAHPCSQSYYQYCNYNPSMFMMEPFKTINLQTLPSCSLANKWILKMWLYKHSRRKIMSGHFSRNVWNWRSFMFEQSKPNTEMQVSVFTYTWKQGWKKT